MYIQLTQYKTYISMYIHRPHAVFCTLSDLLNFDLSQVEQIVKLEILEQVLWDPWGEPNWIDGLIQDGVASKNVSRFRFPGTGCLAFRFVGAYGLGRFAEMVGLLRFVSHLFNIFSVSFRFRFTDRL